MDKEGERSGGTYGWDEYDNIWICKLFYIILKIIINTCFYFITT